MQTWHPLTRAALLAAGSALALACYGDDLDPPPFCPAPPSPRCAAATSTSDLAVVSVLRIETPIADALVLTHRADGSVIARGRTDAEGCVQVPSEAGALVTIASFDGTRPEVVTTTAPPADRRVVHLRPSPGTDCVAGRLRVDVQNPRTLGERDREIFYSASVGCDRYECIGGGSPTEPFEVDIPAHLVGSDGLVHVWIRECITSVDWFQNVVTTCRGTLVLVAPHDDLEVNLGGLLADEYFAMPNGHVEVDGQLFGARLTESEVNTLPRLPFDHVIQHFSAATEPHRNIRLRWPAGERPAEPAPDDYLPTFDGGAMLTETRELFLPAPPYAADSIATVLGIFCGAWIVMLPPGLSPITLPDDPDLPTPLSLGALNATMFDDADHADHESLIGAGLFIGHSSSAQSNWPHIPSARYLRTTNSRLPE